MVVLDDGMKWKMGLWNNFVPILQCLKSDFTSDGTEAIDKYLQAKYRNKI
jgi:hypothetical protein